MDFSDRRLARLYVSELNSFRRDEKDMVSGKVSFQFVSEDGNRLGPMVDVTIAVPLPPQTSIDQAEASLLEAAISLLKNASSISPAQLTSFTTKFKDSKAAWQEA